MPSSIPAARLALFNMLTASPALAGVQVTFAVPELFEDREVLAILGAPTISTDFASLGTSQQEESYQVLLRAKSHDPSCDGSPSELQALDARIWALYEAVRAVVNADQTLGGAINISSIVATADVGQGTESSPVPAVTEEGAADGWVAFLDLRLLCRSRIN